MSPIIHPQKCLHFFRDVRGSSFGLDWRLEDKINASNNRWGAFRFPCSKPYRGEWPWLFCSTRCDRNLSLRIATCPIPYFLSEYTCSRSLTPKFSTHFIPVIQTCPNLHYLEKSDRNRRIFAYKIYPHFFVERSKFWASDSHSVWLQPKYRSKQRKLNTSWLRTASLENESRYGNSGV